MKTHLVVLCCALAGSSARQLAGAPGFAVALETDQLRITHGGHLVAAYVFRDSKVLRPYFKDVHAPGGIQVTRNHPPVEGRDATDHAAMHPGIWLGLGDLNGHDFWRNKARVEHERFIHPPAIVQDEVAFTVKNRYVDPTGAGIGSETCRVQLWARPNGWLLAWESVFEPGAHELVFGDQEEMGLGVRVATPLTVKNGGTMRNSAGGRNEKGTWGKPADWLDYSGTVQGQSAGLLLMAHPENFRSSWMHSRDYGVVVMNPFGQNAFTRGPKSRVAVRAGETFKLRFGVLIYSMPADSSFDRAAAFEEYVSMAR